MYQGECWENIEVDKFPKVMNIEHDLFGAKSVSLSTSIPWKVSKVHFTKPDSKWRQKIIVRLGAQLNGRHAQNCVGKNCQF